MLDEWSGFVPRRSGLERSSPRMLVIGVLRDHELFGCSFIACTSAKSVVKVEIMAEHSGFQKLVAEAKKHITEISPQDAAAKLNSGDAVVVDVRDKDEWDEGHIPGATHMSRGTIELDIEEKVPDPNAMIICHCGGGGRSALAAETLQKMGYKNVRSMAGGLKAWKAAGLPTTT